jgi:hypothetical protein
MHVRVANLDAPEKPAGSGRISRNISAFVCRRPNSSMRTASSVRASLQRATSPGASPSNRV